MNKKKLIIIICAVTAAAFIAALGVTAAITTRNHSPAEKTKNNDVISGLEEPTQITSILRERSFTASTEDGSEASGSETASPETAAESGTTDPSSASEESSGSSYNASTLPAVTGLRRVGSQSDSINLVWKDTKGVKGYRVYWRRSGVEGAIYTLFSTVRNAGLEIRNLPEGSKYDFKVVSFIADEYGSYESKGAEATYATVPAAVSGFRLSAASKDKTKIVWSQNEAADGYIMDRCYDGKWSEYKTFDAGTTEFTDKELSSGRAYFYRIRSYRDDTDGRLKSEAQDLHTVAGMTAPADNGSVSKLGRVSLEYTSSPYAHGYDIYLSENGKKWNLLDSTAETHFTVTGLTDGKTYYFRVYPYRNISYLKVTGPYLEMNFKATSEIYDKQVGDTYIEVSLSDQHMWYVKDGDVYLDSPVVSGNRNSMDTPTGYYSILSKASPCTLRGDDYVSYVDYWMAFIGGSYGLHDASWRSNFGGSIYEGDGSHGCVNLPTEVAKKLYNTASVGTPVIVH